MEPDRIYSSYSFASMALNGLYLKPGKQYCGMSSEMKLLKILLKDYLNGDMAYSKLDLAAGYIASLTCHIGIIVSIL